MKILRRILLTIAITLAFLFVGLYGAAPVAMSYYAARNAAPITKIVPTELADQSVSDAPATKLSYLGYEFEVPWSDLDENQTKLYPIDKPEKMRVDLHFRSGLRFLVSAASPRETEKLFKDEFHVSPQVFEATFGKSDYSFAKTVYEFSPDKMQHWPPSASRCSRYLSLLLAKSLAPSWPAYSGIFNIQNANYRGFQQGDPKSQQEGFILSLYSDEGGIEFVLSLKDYKGTGITQPELNRIIQSVRRARQKESTTRAEL